MKNITNILCRTSLLTIATFMSAQSAIAQSSPSENDLEVLGFEETLAIDAQEYAKAENVTFDEAVDRLLLMRAVRQDLDEANNYDDRSAGVFFEHGGEFKVKQRLKGPKKVKAKKITRDGAKEIARLQKIAEKSDARLSKAARKAARDKARAKLVGSGRISMDKINKVEKALASNQSVSIDYVAGASLSGAEIQALLAEKMSDIQSAIPELQASGYNPVSAKIELEVFGQDSSVEAQLSNQASQIFGYPTTVRISPARLSLETTRGGVGVVNLPGGDRCMTGFSVRRGSQTGVLTAAHCDAKQSYNAPDGTSLTLNLVPGTKLQPAYGDLQMMTATDYFSPTFYAGDGSSVRAVIDSRSAAATNTNTRTVNGLPAGSFICHYSDVQGRTCGYVTNNYFSPGMQVQRDYGTPCSESQSATTCYSSYVKVEGNRYGTGLRALPGDSGGPWFADNTVFGVHSGSSTADGITYYAYYTPVDSLSYMNATLEKW